MSVERGSPSESKPSTEDRNEIDYAENNSSSLHRRSDFGSTPHLGVSVKYERSFSQANNRILLKKNSQEIVECGTDEGTLLLRDESSFISSISQFYDNESLSDVVVRVGASAYKAHKFILAKSSRVFRTMLYGEGWTFGRSPSRMRGDEPDRRDRGPGEFACGTPEDLELEETPECRMVFDKFLRFLYSGEVVVCSSTAIGILCLADKYDVGSLKELCVCYMIEGSKSPRMHNALAWYNWAKLINLESLLKQCSRTICWNFAEVVSSDDWTRVDVDFLVDFLGSSELIVANEYVLFEALVAWLLSENNRAELERYSSVLLPLIRFPQLHVSQLYQVENNPLFALPECKPVLTELISKAYRFRAVCPTQAHLGVCFDEDCFFPRDYTYLVVDNIRIQNTLRFGIQADVKAARTPVPCEVREADWKITYRKQGEMWSLQLYCHDTALLNGETHIQSTIIINNDRDKTIQVHREDKRIFIRGSTVTIQLTIDQPELAKSMAVFIKPVAF